MPGAHFRATGRDLAFPFVAHGFSRTLALSLIYSDGIRAWPVGNIILIQSMNVRRRFVAPFAPS